MRAARVQERYKARVREVHFGRRTYSCLWSLGLWVAGEEGGAEAETKARTDEGIKVEGQAETGIKAGRDGETGDIYGRGKRQGGVNEETDRGERKSNSQSDNPSKQ